MATPTKHLHPAPGSGGAFVAVHAGVEQHELAAGIIMANEVDSYECSVTRKGQPIPPHHEILSIDHHIRVMTSADGVTFDCHEQASTFCLMDACNTCHAKQVHETENHTLAAGFEVITDVDTLDKDQLAEEKGALMVDSYECSATKKGQPIPPNHVIMSTNRHTRVMTTAAGVTFDCHEQASIFCLMDAYSTCHAKQVHETENHTLAAGFEAIADVDITKTTLTDGYRLDADVTAFGATGKPLLALDQDQLTDGKGCIARVKQPVASLEACSASGISAYSMHGTKSVSPLFRVHQVLLFMLVIFLSVAQVSSSAEAKSESADIGSCRFDSTSVATLSCVEPDGSWRLPSMSCCNALLYAIDRLPASNESGARCLCRYISKKYPHFALATSYVLCKGKDRNIITSWSSVPSQCYMVCRQRNSSSHGVDTPAVVSLLGARNMDFRIPWIVAFVVAAFCAILLACFCYHRRYKPIPTGESQPLNLQRKGSPDKDWDGHKRPRRHSWTAQRRMSSRGSLTS